MTKRILILASAEEADRIKINDNFVASLQEKLGSEIAIEWCNYADLLIEFATNSIEVSRLSTGEQLSEFDFVYFKSFFRYSEHAATVAAYLDVQSVPYVCTELRGHIALTKVTQFTRLSLAGIPIAKTVFLHPTAYADQFDLLVEKLGLPFIFKSTDGSGGDENYLIKGKDELHAALTKHSGLHFVAQSFIANDSDLRILIVGGEIQLVIRRTRAGDSHLNNTSQGGSAELVPVEQLSTEHQTIALAAAKIMNREIAGVDLMFESNSGEPYVLEVNASPQIATGAFEKEKLEVYCNYFKKMVQ
jgi:glutathione synthase/RimK-type ligase-like ATP-grasp enzyme